MIIKRIKSVHINLVLFLLGIIVIVSIVFNPVEEYKRWRHGVNAGVKLEGLLIEGMLEDELYELLESISAEVEKLPQNAVMERKTGRMVTEVIGKKIHRTATVKNIMAADKDTVVSLVMIDLYPAITGALLAGINEELGSYHTYIGRGGGGRVTNIVAGAANINYYLLAPGEIFSFNGAVGPVTYERGFRMAPVISGGQIIPGIGGGLCQIASTLYNAVLTAELEVVERTPHSRPVGYVPRGKDATVSTYIDFKFRNDSSKFILIKSSTAGGMINIKLMGQSGSGSSS